MWKTLLVFLLLVGTLWWFFFQEKTVDVLVETNTGWIVLESLSELEYRKYVRQAQARNLGISVIKEDTEKTQEKDVTQISIYKIDENGKLVEDVKKFSLQGKSTITSPELLSFAGSFPGKLEWELSIDSKKITQSISGIQVPDFSGGWNTWSEDWGIIFDPPLVLGDPEPASGNMKFGTWRGNM